MLMQYSTSEILNAIRDLELTSSQMEGAARFFGGYTFRKERQADLTALPDALREKLWRHVEPTTDKDKLARAKRAFWIDNDR